MPGTLWLVGMMGAGKSTVGPLVAAALGMPFEDLDDRIVTAAGRSVPEIFAVEDEGGFRAREANAIAEVAGLDAVVACGGGAVVDPANTAVMRAAGGIAWLDVPADVLVGRIAGGEGRPMLAGAGDERIRLLAADRAEAYRDAADVRIDATGSPDEVAGRVVAWWTRS